MKALLLFFTICLTVSSPFWGDHKGGEKYCAAMRDGVMVLLKDGMIVTSDVIINDSIKVTSDCMIIKKDGSRTSLRDGECIVSDDTKNKKAKSEK
jgi:hypothetical protein